MIDILVIIFMGKKIRRIAEAKGLKPGKYNLIFVASWFGGEFLGVIAGGILTFRGLNDWAPLFMLSLGLAGAVLCGTLGFSAVKNAPDVSQEPKNTPEA